MELTLEQLEYLLTPEAAELLAAELPKDELAAQKWLRRHVTDEQAVAVVVLRQVRGKALAKFPEHLAGTLLATETLMQQASSLLLAGYVGRLLAPLAGEADVLDLCSGMGADAIGMALAGAKVVGYDDSASALLCARHNAQAAGVQERCRFELADVTRLALPADAIVHIDPDRRVTGRRGVSMTECRPAELFLRALPGRSAGGAIKLSPVLDAGELDGWGRVTREYVGENGQCRQLLLRYGRAASEHEAMATVVAGTWDAPEVVSIAGGEAPVRPGPVGAYVIDPDPTVIAAGAVDDLAARHGLWRLDRNLLLLFGDAPIDTPLGRSFRVLSEAPGRQKDIAAALKALEAGTVHVKPRGVPIQTDRMQKTLSGRGGRRLVVFWFRVGAVQRAVIAEAG
ncbi:MAG: methyltransferase domain-containing protein [Planctomycetota bacterium]|nr:methyltransferase domain-containing protein [Planctomycetota bacterium]